MRDIFGPDTKLDRRERDFAQRLVSSRDVLYPVFNGNQLYSIYKESNEGLGKESFGVDIFGDIFKESIIVPFDFIDIPNKDFVAPISNKRKVNEYTSEYRKFIARPDFFYVGFENQRAHIFPVDLKNSNSKGVSQISMMNTAMLYYHSKYMRKIVKYLREELNVEEVIFENGFLLYGKDLRVNRKENLESYLKEYLHLFIQERDKEESNLGIDFNLGKLNLKPGLESLFVCSRTVDAIDINETKLIAYFSFVKSRLSKTTTYPNAICSINGFNGGRKPIYRLEFDPTSHIQTFNPEVDLIEAEIGRIYRMSPSDLFEQYLRVNLSFDERRLEKLEVELAAKKRDKFFRIQKRVEEDLFNSNNRETRLFAVNLDRLDKKIADLEEEIKKVKLEVIKDRQEEHETRLKKGSSQWHKKAVEIRNSLIKRRVEEIEKQKMKALSWEKKDVLQTQLISDFYLKCLLNDDFTLATQPYFSIPTELYLQLHPYNLMKVLVYDSYNIE